MDRGGGVGRALVGGVLAGILSMLFALTFASVVFAGPLQAYVGVGISLAFVGAIVHGLMVAFGSTYRGTVGGVATETAVLGVAATGIARQLGVDDPTTLLATVVAMLVATTFIVGLVYTGLGTARLGNVIRYIPHPVMGGFVAGIGGLLLVGGFGVTTGLEAGEITFARLLEPAVVHHWWPALALGALMYAVQQRIGHYLGVPVILGVTVVGVFSLAAALGHGPRDLMDDGWLLGPLTADLAWSPGIVWGHLAAADWSVLADQFPTLLTFVVIMALGALLIGTSLEVALRVDIELNRELRAAGWSNLLASLGGGFAGYQYIGSTALTHKVGAHSRLTGLTCALACLGVFLIGVDVLGWVPRILAATLLFFMGIDLVCNWLVLAYARLTRTDYIVVVLVFSVVVVFGFMEGVLVGLIAGIVFFAYNYSRVDVVNRLISGAVMHSRVSRPPQIEQLIREHGDEIRIALLDGYIFFGTVNRVVDNIRRMVHEADSIHTVVIDFRRVCGLDSSAAAGFNRLMRLSRQRSVVIALSGLTPEASHLLAHEGILVDQRRTHRPVFGVERRHGEPPHHTYWVPQFADLDAALEWAEDGLLIRHDVDFAGSHAVLESYLRSQQHPLETVERFASYGDEARFRPGESLISQGELADEIYFIVSGAVSVRLSLGSGRNVRLRRIGSGSAIGEVALYVGGTRTASVVADEETVAYVYGREALETMSREEPDLYAAFHEMMARLLAHRLSDLSRIIEVYAS